jgi:predicted DsbA family dithiol-disulfide isomerase
MNFCDLPQAALENTVVGEHRSLTIEVFFDFVCPWCLIGKRNLDTAMRRFAELRPDVQLKVLWRSHQLLPDTPVGGVPYQPFYVDRLGSREAVAARRAQVREAAQRAGVELAFERIEWMPNTALAHELVAYATAHGTDAQLASLIERVFTAYFLEGENIGEPQVLARLGLECGLDRDGLIAHLAVSSGRPVRIARQSHEVNGVPHVVFNAEYAISGAYPADALLDFMARTIQD